jgi:uncharacterized membrane protein
VSYLLVLTSIVMLVLYVTHIGRSLRVSALIELVGNDTRKLLDRDFGDRIVDDLHDPAVVVAPDSGVVTAIDRDRLVELAVETDCVLHVVPALGAFVPAGSPLVRIEGGSGIDHEVVAGTIRSGLERTMDQDMAYGFRMLVDMAERALSESPFLDPTTAVQAIDRIHDGLRQLATRRIPDGRHHDDNGRLRVTVPVMNWDAYVHLAFDEIRLAGIESPQVSRRLVAVLEDLLLVAPSERHPPLRHQLDLIARAVRGLDREDAEVEFGLTGDRQGFGASAGKRRTA